MSKLFSLFTPLSLFHWFTNNGHTEKRLPLHLDPRKGASAFASKKKRIFGPERLRPRTKERERRNYSRQTILIRQRTFPNFVPRPQSLETRPMNLYKTSFQVMYISRLRCESERIEGENSLLSTDVQGNANFTKQIVHFSYLKFTSIQLLFQQNKSQINKSPSEPIPHGLFQNK